VLFAHLRNRDAAIVSMGDDVISLREFIDNGSCKRRIIIDQQYVRLRVRARVFDF
jgi:hypothetical protein